MQFTTKNKLYINHIISLSRLPEERNITTQFSVDNTNIHIFKNKQAECCCICKKTIRSGKKYNKNNILEIRQKSPRKPVSVNDSTTCICTIMFADCLPLFPFVRSGHVRRSKVHKGAEQISVYRFNNTS